jgi:O-methyltransferase
MGFSMYVNDQRNYFVTEKYRKLASKFTELFADGSFVGDDMLIHNCNMSFLRDEQFRGVFEKLAEAPVYQQMAWRLHILDHFLKHALRVGGNYVECGVFRGFKSCFLFENNWSLIKPRKKFLFDTFTGIDPKLAEGSPIKNSDHAKEGLLDFVVQRFKQFENVTVVPGSVPLSLSDVDVGEVCFLHLDMNSWQAELGALEFFLPRMASGGVIVLDDFGLKTHSAQFEHEYPFFVDRGISVLELPTGQGVALL